MSEKKTTKKRPTKKSAGRSNNKTYLGIGIIAAILIIALSVALSIKNNGTEQISKANEPKVEEQISKKAEPKVASKEKKQEYEKRKYPLKFDEDENLSKIFTDPKHKSELALNSKAEPKEQKKIAEVKSEAKKEEIKKEQNDTKNLLASYKNTEPSVIENEQKIESFYSSKIEQKTELKSQNFEVKVDQNKSTEIEKKEKFKNENIKVEPAKKAENLTTKKIEKTKYEEKNIKKDSFEAVPFTPNTSVKGRAKLVIIIDDVATFEHASMIKSLGLKITPSIFPATKTHPDTPNIARTFEFYMIHLPMQAKHFDSPEIGTLTINESFESMHKKIKKIRKDFPRAKYTNNHTGSRFTSDFDAMDKAYRALIEQGFVFVDSKTIAQTAVARAAKKHNQPYISRDIFLDDDPSASAVRRELVAAVNLAKKRGYAIAIGHPKKNTIAVIKESKNNLLKDVDVVYLKDIL
ncbi:divergent polysaccharide deacetylase family protein [Campylobacter concisus]|uniref:divergent polysaccharide deacetylase family protein n=1 Tax=Campylobacter concisus TaxID=199 RepID=UPI0018A8E417|nr:divergent polysaccharide deacetylase family protein [Campylobacter concisus]QPH99749.1 divergent polysaccharide deacetylase family protein [Campylobacter concisus]QPI01542.1 divergent polysaccharide deacetylase family protein [Campylobacter concisus]